MLVGSQQSARPLGRPLGRQLGKKSTVKEVRRVPGRWAGSPHVPIRFLTTFTIAVLRFEGHFSCSVRV